GLTSFFRQFRLFRCTSTRANRKEIMRICVMGTGYVGLVAGACFSESGNHVACLDVDKETIGRLQQGILPIYARGLEEIVESTADKVRAQLKDCRHVLDVVSNPEFLKEDTAVNDFLKPERVIIGCSSDGARRTMADLYAPYVRSGNPILFMSNRSAELSKYAA